MAKLRTIMLILLSCGVFSLANAQNLDMQGTGAAADDGRPTRGTTQARVEADYGAPNRKIAAVGEPPISRWEYDNMVVYFEYDRVIHAVLKR